MNQLKRFAETVFDQPLAIEPAKLRTILAVLGPRFGLGAAQSELQFDLSALNGERRANRRRGFEMRGSVAVVELAGTMVNRAAGMDALSGLASYEALREDMQDAGTDPLVRGVLLRMDSAGGMAAGMFDAADDIRDIAAVKPVWAVTDDAALSAAYLLASQATRVIVSRTGGLGSIGIKAVHVDESERDKKDGLRVIEITSGLRKADLSPHSPLSKEALSAVQAEVDRVAQINFQYVADGRGISIDAVRAQQGAVFYGPAALEAGLADELGNYESALSDLQAAIDGGESTGTTISVAAASSAAAVKQTTKESQMADKTEPTAAAAGTTESPPDAAAIAKEVAEATAKAEQKGYGAAKQVSMLCGLAGMPDQAPKMIADELPPEAAAEKLIELQAEASKAGGEVASQTLPGDGTSAASAESNLVVAACQQLADETKARMGVR